MWRNETQLNCFAELRMNFLDKRGKRDSQEIKWSFALVSWKLAPLLKWCHVSYSINQTHGTGECVSWVLCSISLSLLLSIITRIFLFNFQWDLLTNETVQASRNKGAWNFNVPFSEQLWEIFTGKCFCHSESSKKGCEVPEIRVRNEINNNFQFRAIGLE